MIERNWKQRQDREGRALPDKFEFTVRCASCGARGVGFVDVAGALRIGSEASIVERSDGSLHVVGNLADRAVERAYAHLERQVRRSGCAPCSTELETRASRAPRASSASGSMENDA